MGNASAKMSRGKANFVNAGKVTETKELTTSSNSNNSNNDETGGKLSNTLALGAGCYWGTEKFVLKDFQKKFPNSVASANVGFMAPEPDTAKFKNPTYKQVCSGASGHIEVVHVELNDPEQHLEELLRFFFQFHDPTTKNRQQNDSGFQYASWIFCTDNTQCDIATRVREELQAAITGGSVTVFAKPSVSTKISKVTEFTKAHEEHQEYLAKNPNGYCNHRIRFKNWPIAVKESS